MHLFKKCVITLILFTFIYIFQGCKKDELVTPADNNPKYTLEGKITYDSLPEKGIIVKFGYASCITDSAGHYQFTDIPPGQYLLSVRETWYQRLDTAISLTKNTEASFQLQYRCNHFFPLLTGNYWTLRDSWSNTILKISVVSDTVIRNHKFYKLSWQQGNSTKWRFMMVDKDTLYENECGANQILAPFNIDVGENFVYNNCSYSNSYKGTLSSFYSSDTLLNYYYRSMVPVLDSDFTIYFQKGIGITRFSSAWDSYSLQDYHLEK